MTSHSPRILSCNGVVSYSSETPSVLTFLQTHPGAYTTTRTHNNSSCLMFWERHVQRLANSARILFDSNPQLLFKSADVIPSLLTPVSSSMWESMIKSLVDDSLNKALPVALKERRDGEELAVTVLVEGDFQKLSGIEDVSGSSIGGVFDVYAHFSGYTPLAFGVRGNGARLAVVGRGRDVAEAKYSDWVRVCISKGIPLREVAPSWSEHELWEEAFITSSLRVLQHVESIQVPRTWELHGSKCWDEIAWKEKQFEESPGMITKVIQKEIMERAGLEGFIVNR